MRTAASRPAYAIEYHTAARPHITTPLIGCGPKCPAAARPKVTATFAKGTARLPVISMSTRDPEKAARLPFDVNEAYRASTVNPTDALRAE